MISGVILLTRLMLVVLSESTRKVMLTRLMLRVKHLATIMITCIPLYGRGWYRITWPFIDAWTVLVFKLPLRSRPCTGSA